MQIVMETVSGIGIFEDVFPETLIDTISRIYDDSPNKYQGKTHGKNNGKDVKVATQVDLYNLNNSELGVDDFDVYEYCDQLNKCMTEYFINISNEYELETNYGWDYRKVHGGIKTNYEFIKVHNYPKGEGHYIALHQDRDGHFEALPRVFNFLLYLNDVKDGGETVFPIQKVIVSPRRNRLVMWPSGWPYLHHGKIPLSEDKKVVTAWLEVLYG